MSTTTPPPTAPTGIEVEAIREALDAATNPVGCNTRQHALARWAERHGASLLGALEEAQRRGERLSEALELIAEMMPQPSSVGPTAIARNALEAE